MTEIDALIFQSQNLKKLHKDLEKQMIKFDEILPFDQQTTALIFSPRLLNMMLVCCPQIEAIVELIALRCDFIKEQSNNKKIKKNIPKLIRKINKKAILSDFKIVSKKSELLFTPFTLNLEWWTSYNGLKHNLARNQFQITYTTVMDSLASLSALHCLADKLLSVFEKDIPKVLDCKNWISEDEMIKLSPFVGTKTKPSWESLLFEIRSEYYSHPLITK